MPGIYPLPEKPTAADIIRRSIVAHPSLFADSLRSQEITHKNYALNVTNPRTLQGVNASARACERARHIIGDDYLTEDDRAAKICKDCGMTVIALNVACKLQCLPAHIRTAAAVAWEDAR